MDETADRLVWLVGTVVEETQKALRVERPGGLPDLWVPKSQVVLEARGEGWELPVGEQTSIPVSAWWAETAGVHPERPPAKPGWKRVLATHRKLAWSRARAGLDDVRAVLREEGDDNVTQAFVELTQRYLDDVEQLGIRR